MSKEKKKLDLNLELCYSGFKIDELEYMDYTRSITENDVEVEEGAVALITPPRKSTCYDRTDSVPETEDGMEGILPEYDYDEYANNSTDDFHSYRCSTPNGGRKHRGSFPQEGEISGFNLEHCTKNYARRYSDSGIRTRSLSRSSLVSFYREAEGGAEQGSVEDLNSTHSSGPDHRRKIDVGVDVLDPNSIDDDFELSIEDEASEFSEGGATTLATFRRRLSLKMLRRNTSFGLFGSYLQKQQPTVSLSTSSCQQPSQSKDGVPLLGHRPTGPVNYWFRKFRNRHYI